MRLAAVGLVAGLALLQHQAALQTPLTRWALAGLVLAGVVGALRVRGLAPGAPVRRVGGLLLPLLVASGAGVLWGNVRADWRLADSLALALEGETIQVTGRVIGLPQPVAQGQRFGFAVEDAPAGVPRRLWLGWYPGRHDDEDADVGVAAGERWRLSVRLRRPHGLANPHGFDYEAWLFQRDFRATGTVRRSPHNRRLDSLVMRPDSWVAALRSNIRERFEATLPDAANVGVLTALAIGDQRAIPVAQWQVFTRTGIGHLMSVSGLHITMIGGLAAWLISLAWRRSEWLCLRVPARKAAALAGLLAAVAYATLAGMEVPAQRTVLMLGVVALSQWLDRRASPSLLLAWAAIVVCVVDPWAVVSPGFWLSFGAVAFLLLVGGGMLVRVHPLAAWGRAQWGVTLGLIPLLLALFQQFPLVSPIANAVAIPVVSFIVTPLALLAAALPIPALLVLAHAVFAVLMGLLEWLAELPWSTWQQAAPPVWASLLAVAGSVAMLLPRGVPLRGLGWMLLLPALFPRVDRPEPGEARVRVLDVGQGLAVHVQTAGHDLMYDAGPRYGRDTDAGDRVLLPYLRGEGVRHLHAVVLSHDDADHVGGARSLMRDGWVGSVLTSLAPDHPAFSGLGKPMSSCAAGTRWEWDEVSFHVLGPEIKNPADPQSVNLARDNNRSCVLKVSANGQSLLLVGDLEAEGEHALLERAGDSLRADLLVLGHHGSRSSSSAAFLDAVAPAQALVSAGYGNRFGHPHTEVLQRVMTRGIAVSRTDKDGALFASIGRRTSVHADLGQVEVGRQRALQARYWHGH